MDDAATRRRKMIDIRELMKHNYRVTFNQDSLDKITVNMPGPKDSIYESGNWDLVVEFHKDYPYKSPSVGFITKIYHPNVDYDSGSICLDALNQEWTPIYNLVHIFDTLLPQLLMYPNPDDPLNLGAAQMMLTNEEAYFQTVLDNIWTQCPKEESGDGQD